MLFIDKYYRADQILTYECKMLTYLVLSYLVATVLLVNLCTYFFYKFVSTYLTLKLDEFQSHLMKKKWLISEEFSLEFNLWSWHSDINSILLPKLFLPTVRKKCCCDQEKPLIFEAEGQEFAYFLRSLEQFIQTVEDQNNFRYHNVFSTCSWRFLRTQKIEQL